MRAPIFQVDAFATHRFAGNPAAVLALERFPDDAVMQAIAAENNLAVFESTDRCARAGSGFRRHRVWIASA